MRVAQNVAFAVTGPWFTPRLYGAWLADMVLGEMFTAETQQPKSGRHNTSTRSVELVPREPQGPRVR